MPELLDRFARERRTAPVSRDSQYGAWNVYRYDDVKTVLSDHARFSSQQGRGRGGNNPQHALADSLISTDPPRHRQLRTLVERAFTPRAVDALAPRIHALVHELLDRLPQHGTDLIRDFAVPLPVTVIAEILGIPSRDRVNFKRWSDDTITGNPSGTREMAVYFTRLIAERRARGGGDDLISRLILAEDEGQHLTSQELMGFCMLLLVAGNETTTNLIGNAVRTLTANPDAQEFLTRHPDVWPGAIEEVLRYRSPVRSMFRVATQDTRLGGQFIRAGEWVVGWIESANHDEEQFPHPQVFDVHRSPNRHLSFGHGIHFCLGAPLARLEARVALQALYERHPKLRVHENVTLRLVPGTIVHGVRELPVRLNVP